MTYLRPIFFIIAASVLAGCGSSSDSGPVLDGSGPVSGIGRTGVAVGPISTFGSIVVNGVHYDTDSATITINSQPATQGDLRVGQVVVISGSIDDGGTTGTANTVIFDDNVKGPIQSIDPAAGTLLVLGQQVLVGDATSFDDSINPGSLAGLSVDDIVEVSGLVNADGEIAATRIELESAATSFEVLGIASDLDTVAFTFSINDLTIDYSAAELDGFPAGEISNGDLVEVEGSSFAASSELIATEVNFEDPLGAGDEGDRLELEGFITRFESATDFDVSGIPVTTSASTVYEDGGAADLGLNVKVEVEGDFDASGVLVATEIEIDRAKAVRAGALIDSVDSTGNSLVLLGITVTVDSKTRFEDQSDAHISPLTLADLSAGDYVEVRGDESPAGSGQLTATILERDDADDEVKLRGYVQSLSQPGFAILGVTVETDATTQFSDENEQPMSATEFFSRVTVNSLVEVEGSETSATVILAEEVELKDDD